MTENLAGNYLLRDLYQVYECNRKPVYGDRLVELMGLADEVSDRKTLGDRVVGTSALENITKAGLESKGLVEVGADAIPMDEFDLLYIVRHVGMLVASVESGSLNEGESLLASALSKVVVRQIVREGNICNIAGEFARRVAKVRPDLINPNILR